MLLSRVKRHEIHALPEAGVYRIVNERNGKIYVGASMSMRQRLMGHRNRLRHNAHSNLHLQSAWLLNGETDFTFEAIAAYPIDRLFDREQWWIDYYRANGTKLYNQRPVAESQLGFRMSDESRAKMSAAKLRMSAETKVKISEANKRFREENPGYYIGLRRTQTSWNKGKKLTAEHRKNLRLACVGRKPSDETRAKLRVARAGRRPGLGRIQSQEEIARRAESLKVAWAKKTPQERSAIGHKSWMTRRAS